MRIETLDKYFGTDDVTKVLINDKLDERIANGEITEDDITNRPDAIIRETMTSVYIPIDPTQDVEIVTIAGEAYKSDGLRYVKLAKVTASTTAIEVVNVSNADTLSGYTANDFARVGGNISIPFDVGIASTDSHAVSKGQLISLLPKTTVPTLTTINAVNENSESIFTYTPIEGQIVTLSTTLGTIISHNLISGEIVYRAPNIVEVNGVLDNVYISTTAPGELKSDIIQYDINVLYVPIIADTAISNTDFQTFESYNNGFNY